MRMQRVHYRQMCDKLGLKKFAERWVLIKVLLCGGYFKKSERGHREFLVYGRFKPAYPSMREQYVLRNYFAIVSNAFDRVLYKRGKRHTVRDNIWSSEHALARHNMVLMSVDAHVIFPLLKFRLPI